MGWSIGYDSNWNRDIGYGVPAICDYPSCDKEIDRGLSYVCGGEPYGGENGCGLHFCMNHLDYDYGDEESDDFDEDEFDEDELRDCQLCERCIAHDDPFEAKPDVKEWIEWKLTDESWEDWRIENPQQVETMKQYLKLGE